MKTHPTINVSMKQSRNVKPAAFRKSIVLLLTVCMVAGLVLSLAPAADAGWRTLCHYTEFSHPNTNYGLTVTVEEKYGKVTGDFHVGFYADGHVFGSQWMSSTYNPYWGLYVASRMFYYGAGERYKVYLYLHNSFSVAYLKVEKEYLMNFMGYQYWVGLTNEAPLVAKWVQINKLGCNYY